MRNALTGTIAGVASALVFSAFSSVALAQSAPAKPEAGALPTWKYIPTDRAIGPGGPAPKRDLSGTWAGPRSGAGVPDGERADKPVMTPLGQQLFDQNKPLGKFSPAGTNDPSVRYCDPFGFPRSAVAEIRGLSFATMPNRIVVLTQFFAVWREVWMDGRPLPKNVGSADKNSPDPRFNGYSVGHWEGDDTLVIETTGLDDRTWLSGSGYPHTINAHVTERYTRTSHNDLHLSVTVDDPTLYTKPFVLSNASFRWIPNQQLDEKMCVPSETIEYLKAVGDPAGSDPNAPPVRY